MDTVVTEVGVDVSSDTVPSFTLEQVPPEEVLNDSNGVLLGAGPYMLIYSRRVSPEYIDALLPWPNSYTVCTVASDSLCRLICL